MEWYNNVQIKNLTIQHLLEYFCAEDSNEGKVQLLGVLPLEVREILWAFAQALLGKVRMRDGEAGQACRMVEVYLAKKYTIGHFDMRPKNTLFLFATTLCLVSEAQHNVHFLNAYDIVGLLIQRGIYCNMEDIYYVRRVLFETLNAHVSVWTNVQKVHVLALQLHFKNTDVPFAGAVMDWVELQLPILMEEFQLDAASSSETYKNILSLRNSHLIAGVLVAAHKILGLDGNVTLFLASWSYCAPYYIEWLGNIINSNVMENVHGKFKSHLRSCEIVLTWIE